MERKKEMKERKKKGKNESKTEKKKNKKNKTERKTHGWIDRQIGWTYKIDKQDGQISRQTIHRYIHRQRDR